MAAQALTKILNPFDRAEDTLQHIQSDLSLLTTRTRTLLDDLKLQREKSLKEISNAHEKAQKDVSKERAELARERAEWEVEKSLIKSQYKFEEPLVQLNVGGKCMTTRLSTLKCSGGFLESLFSGKFTPDKDKDGNIFIDQDGEDFVRWLKLLRVVSNGNCARVPNDLHYLADFLQPSVQYQHSINRTVDYYLHVEHRGVLCKELCRGCISGILNNGKQYLFLNVRTKHADSPCEKAIVPYKNIITEPDEMYIVPK